MKGRGDSRKACFSLLNFTDFIFQLIALEKIPLKLCLPIYILFEVNFSFLVLSLKEKNNNFLSHLIFSTLYPVFFCHFQKCNSNKKSSFSCSFHWYLTNVGQIFFWFCEIFWSGKNHFSRYSLLKIFFPFTPVLSFVFIWLAWNFHIWLCKPCCLTSEW